MLQHHNERITAEQFCYWLQGFAEIQSCADYNLGSELPGNRGLSKEQWRMVKEHLQHVFIKVTGQNTGALRAGIDPGFIPEQATQGLNKTPAYEELVAQKISKRENPVTKQCDDQPSRAYANSPHIGSMIC